MGDVDNKKFTVLNREGLVSILDLLEMPAPVFAIGSVFYMLRHLSLADKEAVMLVKINSGPEMPNAKLPTHFLENIQSQISLIG